MTSITPSEGVAEVPGASLRYRLAGTPGALPLVVLENGWGASYDYFSLLQKELSPHTQLLLYNRAGIGGSQAHEPQSVEGMSRNLSALLDRLGFYKPVVIAGQSYGGLICGVHASLIPQRLCAAVQIDPTIERPDHTIDSTVSGFRGMAKLMIALARLGIRVPSIVGRIPEIPPDDAAKLHRNAFQNAASLRAAMVEMDLLSKIREMCAKPSPTPRLVISAENVEEVSGVMKLFISPERARNLLLCAQKHHKVTADRGGSGSRWTSLPHTHGGLVMTRQGALDTAASLVDYLRNLRCA